MAIGNVICDVVEWPVRVDTSSFVQELVCGLAVAYYHNVGCTDRERKYRTISLSPFFESTKYD